MYYIKTRMFDRNGNIKEETRTAATYTVRGAMGELRMWGFEPYYETMPETFKRCKLPKCWMKDGWNGVRVNAQIVKEA